MEGRRYIDEAYPDGLATLDPNIKARFDLATKVSAVDKYSEQRQIERLPSEFDLALRHIDVLVAPTVPITLPTVGKVADADTNLHANGQMTRDTRPISLLGFCAVTMPVALDEAGMPAGLKLIGRRDDDEHLFWHRLCY